MQENIISPNARENLLLQSEIMSQPYVRRKGRNKVPYLHLQILLEAALSCGTRSKEAVAGMDSEPCPFARQPACYQDTAAPGPAPAARSAPSEGSVPQSRAALTCQQIHLLPFHSSKICQSLRDERETTNKDFWHL